MGHFYRYDGTPVFTYKNSKGEEKETTLREAKKFGLLPSVTTYTGVLRSFALSQWEKKNFLRGILSSPSVLNLYDGTENGLQKTFDEIEKIVSVQNVAPVIGTQIHKDIEEYVKGIKTPPIDSLAFQFIGRLNIFLTSRFGEGFTLRSEVPFAGQGYGGTTDLILTTKEGKNHIIDFKTTTRKKFELWKQPYLEECAQIAAYIKGIRFAHGICVEPNAYIIKIDNEKGGIKAYNLQTSELRWGWKFFGAALKAYAISNDYEELETMFNAQNPTEVKNLCEKIAHGVKTKMVLPQDSLTVLDGTEGIEGVNKTTPLPPPLTVTTEKKQQQQTQEEEETIKF